MKIHALQITVKTLHIQLIKQLKKAISAFFLIQSKFANDSTFSFNEASLSDIEKELILLKYTSKNSKKKAEDVVRISFRNSLTTL